MAQQLTQRKQQGQSRIWTPGKMFTHINKVRNPELQLQYTNYKNGLQQIAQKIGDVEQEAEEHSSYSFVLQSFGLFNGKVPRFCLASFDPLPHRW